MENIPPDLFEYISLHVSRVKWTGESVKTNNCALHFKEIFVCLHARWFLKLLFMLLFTVSQREKKIFVFELESSGRRIFFGSIFIIRERRLRNCSRKNLIHFSKAGDGVRWDQKSHKQTLQSPLWQWQQRPHPRLLVERLIFKWEFHTLPKPTNSIRTRTFSQLNAAQLSQHTAIRSRKNV